MKNYPVLISLRSSDQGFTLVELMVAMVISLLTLAAIYSTFTNQHQSYIIQEQVAALQQNLRAGMFLMETEIRMAGCDPTGMAGTGFTATNPTSMTFTMDYRGAAAGSDPNGNANDNNENIAYSWNSADLTLRRNGNIAAENIQIVDFVYLDADRNPTAVPANIRTVEVTMVARSNRPVKLVKDTTAYFNQQGTLILAAQNDNYIRKHLAVTVKCRNMGL